MTKTIEILNEVRKKECAYKYTKEEVNEAIDQAIKALEQQPCDDCISREAVIEWLKDKDVIKMKYQEENARRGLASLPSVTPQPKIGHWIIIDDCEQFIAKCSECGRIEDSRMINKYPYCHCGAKMLQADSELKESKDLVVDEAENE